MGLRGKGGSMKDKRFIWQICEIILCGLLITCGIVLLLLLPPETEAGLRTILAAAVFLLCMVLCANGIYLLWRIHHMLENHRELGDQFREYLLEQQEQDQLSKGDMAYLEQLLHFSTSSLQKEFTSQILLAQSEIHSLQNQINPHFLYNTLENIRSRALLQNCFEVAEMAEALAMVFRYSISQPNEMATLKEELENAKNFLMIQNHRFNNKFGFEERIEDESIYSCRLPIMTIQPLIENAIYHGLELKDGVGTITIHAYCSQERITLCISDDGIGMDITRLQAVQASLCNSAGGFPSRKKNGIALINVDQRLRFYFGPEYGLKIFSMKNVGTTVQIELPTAK